MAHQYKVGDKVRIKKREGDSRLYPFNFCDSMNKFAGTICEIKKIRPITSFSNPQSKYINGDYHMYDISPIDSSDHRDFVWAWHSSMFEPVLEDSKLTTSTSLKEGDLIPICGMLGKITDDTGDEEYYLNFNGIENQLGHFACCDELRELFPNFEKIANEFDAIQINPGGFPLFSTIDDLVKFTQAVNNAYNSKKSITTTKTLNENEIRFQKPKTSSIRGTVPTGRAICGRRHKTAIKCGHLSNTTCYC